MKHCSDSLFCPPLMHLFLGACSDTQWPHVEVHLPATAQFASRHGGTCIDLVSGWWLAPCFWVNDVVVDRPVLVSHISWPALEHLPIILPRASALCPRDINVQRSLFLLALLHLQDWNTTSVHMQCLENTAAQKNVAATTCHQPGRHVDYSAVWRSITDWTAPTNDADDVGHADSSNWPRRSGVSGGYDPSTILAVTR